MDFSSVNPESVQVRALLQLRELILSGELPGGTRVTELAIVERLGASRTPVRAALLRLAQEGLLESLPHGGYVINTFTERDVGEAIELRGTLEGLLVRFAAELGVAPGVLDEAGCCLDEIDSLLKSGALNDAAFSSYVRLNAQFHALLSNMANSKVMARELDRVLGLPFASPSAFVVAQANSPAARDMLVIAQDQHRQVLDAIARREGGRAEALMREHSRIAQRNLHEVLHSHAPSRLPGVQLIRRQPD